MAKALQTQVDASASPLGAQLRERRRQLGLTLKEVADGAGLSVGFISQIERGITVPLADIADFGMSHPEIGGWRLSDPAPRRQAGDAP